MATSENKPTKNGSLVEKEGTNLMGAPTFEKLDNGRFKCVETGHELPSHAKNSYAQSKRCRIGLIDFALTKNKPPLNMFKQDPVNSSKLICKLTGDTINKSEEHIWKHINGKRFFNKLEQLETGESPCNVSVEEKGSKGKENGAEKKRKDCKDKKNKEPKKEEIVSAMRDSTADSDTEESEFWMPPKGERWDFDDGGDRWGSDSESGGQLEEDDGEGMFC
ncbi:Surfeit locus protein 2 [Bienertia sinuspersici]